MKVVEALEFITGINVMTSIKQFQLVVEKAMEYVSERMRREDRRVNMVTS